jgi:histidinol-phosphate phosphatase family protein
MSRTPNGSAARPFVFLEKAALLQDQPLNVDPARLRFASGWMIGVERLHRAGFAIAIVSNESGLAFGFHDEHALEAVQRQVAARFAGRGIEIADFLYCPHHQAGTVARYAQACDCRLPSTGLFRRAAHELGADLERSWLIGTTVDATVAAGAAGCRAILVDSGQESELLVSRRQPQSHQVAPDISAAAALLIEEHHADAAA